MGLKGMGESDDRASPFSDPGPALSSSLTNHLLVAMPSLTDPNFTQSVALICEHTEKGALGIVLNKPLPMTLSDVLSRCSNSNIKNATYTRGQIWNILDRSIFRIRPQLWTDE